MKKITNLKFQIIPAYKKPIIEDEYTDYENYIVELKDNMALSGILT